MNHGVGNEPHRGHGHHRPPPSHHHHAHHQHHGPQQPHHHGLHQLGHNQGGPPPKWHSYKVLVDSAIHRGAPKMIRYDGSVVPGNPHHVPPTPSDPRKKLPNTLWKRLEPIDLPVPKLKIDENYVGEPPKVEVTIENLNDNVDRQFLNQMVNKFGGIVELMIYFHPLTKKHLGLARIVFEEVRSAKECVKALHCKSVMGKQLTCYLDPNAASCRKMFQELTEEKKPEIPPPTAEPSPSVEEEVTNHKPPSPKWERKEIRDPRSLDVRDRESRRSSSDHRSDHRRDHLDRRHTRDWNNSNRHSSRDDNRNSSWEAKNSISSIDKADSNSLDFHDIPHSAPISIPSVPLNDNNASNVPLPSKSHYGPSSQESYYSHPDYWLQKAQQFAAQAAQNAQEAVGAVDNKANADQDVGDEIKQDEMDKQNVDDEGGDHHLDLDTRLKMLMKDKSGAMPAFLLEELNGSETDGEGGESKVEDGSQKQNMSSSKSVFPLLPDEVPLDRPPSPFLSTEHYLQSHQEWVEEKRRLRNVNQESDFEKTISGFQPLKISDSKKRPNSRNSDKMSLSSLSSSENNILEQGTLPTTGYPAPSQYSYYPPGYPPPQQSHWMPDGYPSRLSVQYPPQYMHDPSHYPPVRPEGYYSHSNWSADHYGYPDTKETTVTDVQAIINDSSTAFIKDLKRTIRKDIKKKMCETLAFNHYEKWWQEQEEKYKAKSQRQQSKSVAPSSTVSGTANTDLKKPNEMKPSSEATNSITNSSHQQAKTLTKAEDLSSIFDKQREKLESSTTTKTLMGGTVGMGGSLGFGFRGTIPKLPSFKKKTRPSADEEKRRQDSSDEGRSRNKSRHEKIKEYEKRREDRLLEKKKKKNKEEEQSEKYNSNRDKANNKHSSSSKKKTLGSMLSAIYSDESDVSDTENKKFVTKKKYSSENNSDSDVRVQPKSTSSASKPSKKFIRTSSTEEPMDVDEEDEGSESSTSTSSEVSSDSFAISSAVSSSSLSTSMSESSEVSSSSLSSESDSEVEERPKKTKMSWSKKTSKSPTSKEVVEESSSSSSDMELGLESESEKSDISNKDATKRTKPVGEVTNDKSKTDPDVKEGVEENVEEHIPVEKQDLISQDKSKQVAAKNLVETLSVPDVSSPHIMDHSYAKPSFEPEGLSLAEQQQIFETQFALDHGYTKPRTPPKAESPTQAAKDVKEKIKKALEAPLRKSSAQIPKPQPLVNTKTFKPRDSTEQFNIGYRILKKGLDLEDINYLKRSYEIMLNKQDVNQYWLNDTHWVDHPVTDIPDPPKKKRHDDYSRPHLTGSCRTEGRYKMDPREKANTKYHMLSHPPVDLFSQTKIGSMEGSTTKGTTQTAQSLSREVRSMQRRQLAVLGDELIHSDLLKFNQLKFRRKRMIFGKSAIHDWGLFALEDIGADEMVIEYVGEVIRPVISDVREKRYERQGIGSSYLFRIDSDNVVDATKRGNLARFINHSCDPNCYAKVITVDQKKKIVIYSKQAIATGEEITYDYKFEIEEEKIRCLCQAKNCKKYLN